MKIFDAICKGLKLLGQLKERQEKACLCLSQNLTTKFFAELFYKKATEVKGE